VSAAIEIPGLAFPRSSSPASDPDVRCTGIGGSDIAPVAGFVVFDRTALSVYEEKLGLRLPEDIGEAGFWGTVFEDDVANEAARRLGVKIARVNKTLRHPNHPELMAHLDRRIVGPLPYGLTGRWALEVKTTNAFAAREGWGDNAEDLPIHVQLQVQDYCEVANLDGVIVAVLIGGQKLLIFFVHRDRDMGANIVKVASRFWHEHVLKKIPPAVATYEEAKRAFPQHVDRSIAADDEIAATVATFAELKAREKQLAEEIDKAQTAIARFLGESDTLTVYNDPVLTWRTQTQRRLSESAFKAAHPDLYAQFVRESTIRVMRLKGNAK